MTTNNGLSEKNDPRKMLKEPTSRGRAARSTGPPDSKTINTHDVCVWGGEGTCQQRLQIFFFFAAELEKRMGLKKKEAVVH